MSDMMFLPKTIPKRPKGWTKHLLLHLNFGPQGGAASYEIRIDGKATPIIYQYDTRKGGLTGFSLPDVDGVLTWSELRAEWPAFLKRQPPPEAQP